MGPPWPDFAVFAAYAVVDASCSQLLKINVGPIPWLLAGALLCWLIAIALRFHGQRRLMAITALALAMLWLPDVLLERIVMTPERVTFRKGTWPRYGEVPLDLEQALAAYHVERWPRGRLKEAFLVLEYPEQRRASHRLTGLAARSRRRLMAHIDACGVPVRRVRNRVGQEDAGDNSKAWSAPS